MHESLTLQETRNHAEEAKLYSTTSNMAESLSAPKEFLKACDLQKPESPHINNPKSPDCRQIVS
jgi:hypothetical protein